MTSNPPFAPALPNNRRKPKFSKRLQALALAVALSSGLPLSSRGFALEGYWWHTSTIPMRVQLGSSNVVLADGSVDFNSVAENAMKLWNEQLGGVQFTWTV